MPTNRARTIGGCDKPIGLWRLSTLGYNASPIKNKSGIVTEVREGSGTAKKNNMSEIQGSLLIEGIWNRYLGYLLEGIRQANRSIRKNCEHLRALSYIWVRSLGIVHITTHLQLNLGTQQKNIIDLLENTAKQLSVSPTEPMFKMYNC